jgi:outer membrane protein TolC
MADSNEGVLTLERAVKIAVEKNPAARKSTEDIQGARYAERSAKSGFYPSLSASCSVTVLDDAPYMTTAGMNVPVAHKTQYNWGVTLVQPLFTGFAVSSRHDMASLTVAVREKEREQTVRDIEKGVKSAYYRVLLTGKILKVAEDALETLASHEKDARRFHERGIIRLNDLLRAQVALSGAVQARERAKADADMARADLNRWLASDINSDTRIEPVDDIRIVHPSLDRLIETGLRERPQLQAMALVRKTLEKAVTLEKSAYYPTVAAVGAYWRSGDSLDASSNDYANDHNASLSVQATWTLFEGGRTRAEVARAQSAKRSFDESVRQAEDYVRIDIKSACLDLGVAEHNVATSKSGLAQAEENLRITRLGYRQEAATSTEVLDARTDLTGAQTRYYQALYGYLDALANLEHAVGRTVENGPDADKTILK